MPACRDCNTMWLLMTGGRVTVAGARSAVEVGHVRSGQENTSGGRKVLHEKAPLTIRCRKAGRLLGGRRRSGRPATSFSLCYIAGARTNAIGTANGALSSDARALTGTDTGGGPCKPARRPCTVAPRPASTTGRRPSETAPPVKSRARRWLPLLSPQSTHMRHSLKYGLRHGLTGL